MKGDSTTRSVAGLAALSAPVSSPPDSAEGAARSPPAAPQGSDAPGSPAIDAGSRPLFGTPAPKRMRAVQGAVALTLLGLALLIGWRIGSVEGLWRVARVEGPSMAPALPGVHYQVTCADCRFSFRCDAVDAPADGLAVCPNCGYSQNHLEKATLASAQQVLIDRWGAAWRAPRRYDIVAAREVADKALIVKRVAGLPGERLAIREGDLYDGKQLLRKSPAELRHVREIVHDNNFQPEVTARLPPRWQGTSVTSGWHASGTGFRYRPGKDAAKVEPLDWLEYQHWQCVASPLARTRLSPVLDNDSYNQAASRQLNAVPDVQLSCRLQVRGQGRLALAAVDGDQRFEVVFDVGPSGWQGRLISNQVESQSDLAFRSDASDSLPVQIAFGLCDQQVLLAVGGRLLVRHSYERPNRGQTTLHPLAIGASGVDVYDTDLQVWRDQFLLEPLGTHRPWEAEAALSSGQYALIGDNLALSSDSRSWAKPGVPRRTILGRVYPPFWATH